jgi:hypothetical protein
MKMEYRILGIKFILQMELFGHVCGGHHFYQFRLKKIV